MSSNGSVPATTTGGSTRLIGSLVILVLGAVALYYLYDYMYSTSTLSVQTVMVGGPVKADSTTGIDNYPAASQDLALNQYIFTGGTMSVSFWMYVTGQGTTTNTCKHILSLGTSSGATANPTLLIALGGASNVLYVRVNDGTSPSSFQLGTFMTTPNASTSPCNIQNIEYGRWVNVTVVLNNNMSDVYLDGKLSRSCILQGQYQVAAGSAGAPLAFSFCLPKATGDTGASTPWAWNGSFANCAFYSYALAPDQVYRIYMAGPSGGGANLWSQIQNFFGKNIVATKTA